MVGPISPLAAQQPPVPCMGISTPPRRFFGLHSLTPCSCFGAPVMTMGRLLPRKRGHSNTALTITTKMLRIGCWKTKAAGIHVIMLFYLVSWFPRPCSNKTSKKTCYKNLGACTMETVSTVDQTSALLIHSTCAWLFGSLGLTIPPPQPATTKRNHRSLRCSSASSSLCISLMRVEAVLPSFSWSEGQTASICNYICQAFLWRLHALKFIKCSPQ